LRFVQVQLYSLALGTSDCHPPVVTVRPDWLNSVGLFFWSLLLTFDQRLESCLGLNRIAFDYQRDYANETWATRSLSRGLYDSLPNCLNGYLQQMSCSWNLSSERSAGRSQAREPCIVCKWSFCQR
jgi:hypothetical protein